MRGIYYPPPFSGAYGDLSGKPTLGTAAEKDTGTTNGTIPLIGAGDKLAVSIMPAITINESYSVASEEAMLLLSANEGDFAMRSDVSKTYILAGADPSVLENWLQWNYPPDVVTSVDGAVGDGVRDVCGEHVRHFCSGGSMKARCAVCGTEIELSPEAAEFITQSDEIAQVRPLCNECGEQGHAEMVARINDRPEYVAMRAIGG